MNTQALLTDLTPEQEEVISGGRGWWKKHWKQVLSVAVKIGEAFL